VGSSRDSRAAAQAQGSIILDTRTACWQPALTSGKSNAAIQRSITPGAAPHAQLRSSE
jgi:primosomal replication protein N